MNKIIHIVFSLTLLVFLITLEAEASSGFSYSIEMQSFPLNKKVETMNGADSFTLVNGRETSEWLGIEGYTDINSWFRFLYGLQGTLAGAPILKASGSLGIMIPYKYKFPINPYVFAGVEPVLSMNTNLKPLGMAAHAGLGIEYNWNQTLYSQFELKSYVLGPYWDEKDENSSPSKWLPGSFSLKANLGFNY